MPQENRKDIKIEDYFWTIWRSKFSIFIIFIVAVGTAFLKNDLSAPVYEAKARIWIKDEQNKMPLFEDFLSGNSMMGKSTFIETLKEIVRSRYIVKETVEELELAENPLPKHQGKIISGLANLFNIELKDKVYDKYTEDILYYQKKLKELKDDNPEYYNIERCLIEIKNLNAEIAEDKDRLETILDKINEEQDNSVLSYIKPLSRNLASQTNELLSYQNKIGLGLSESLDFDRKYLEKIEKTENRISSLVSNLDSQLEVLERDKELLRIQRKKLEQNKKMLYEGIENIIGQNISNKIDSIEKRIEVLDLVNEYGKQMIASARTLLDNRRQFVEFKQQEQKPALQVLEAFTVITESQRLRKKKCIENLIANLSVRPLRDTNIIEVSVQSGNPDRAQEIANTISKNFKIYMREDKQAQMKATTNFAEDKVIEIENRLKEAESDLARYQEKHNMVDVETEAEMVIKTLEELKTKLTDAEGQRIGAERKYKNLLEQLKSLDEKIVSSETLTDNPTLIDLRDVWIKDKIKLAELREKYPTGEHAEIALLEAKMKEEREEISKLQEKIISSQTTTINPIHQQINSDIIQTMVQIDTAKAQEEVLKNKIVEYQEVLRSMPEKQVELAKKKREVNLYQSLLTSLQETKQKSSILREGEVGNVKELDRAYKPEEPISPRKSINLLLGALIGISLGVGLAFLRDSIDNRYHTIEEAQRDFESLSSEHPPVYLGLIPPILDENQQGSVPLMSNVSRKGDNALEAFRLIRTKLQFLRPNSTEIRTMLVTSSVPGEGKTTISVNTAITLARMQNKVLLIDADLRKPKLHKAFSDISIPEENSEDNNLLAKYKSDSKKKPGLSEILLEIGHNGNNMDKLLKQITRTVADQENLYLITSGTNPPEPSQLLSSKSMRDLINYLEKQYDYVIIDAPPAGFADPMVISDKVDCVLYVLDLSKAKKPEVRNGLDNIIEISSDSSTPIGVICNWADMSGIEYYYGYHYGGYYSYYRYKYGYYGSYYYDYDERREKEKGISRLKKLLFSKRKKQIESKDDEDTEN